MTLTFNLATWFLFATHYIVMKSIFAKLFSNPFMHDKVIDRTRTCFTEAYAQNLSANCDLGLWPSDMLFFYRDTLSRHGGHLYQIIFISHHARQSYGSDKS